MSKRSHAGGGGKKGTEDDQDAPLQAVVSPQPVSLASNFVANFNLYTQVLTDSFQNHFRPLTLEKPRV